jgi:hypothetical protein
LTWSDSFPQARPSCRLSAIWSALLQAHNSPEDQTRQPLPSCADLLSLWKQVGAGGNHGCPAVVKIFGKRG